MENEEGKNEIMERGVGAVTLDVRDASPQGLALMEERVRNQKKMLAVAIGLTAPNQWTIFSGTDKNGELRETIYPTGGAADTILRRAFGLTWGEKDITVEETPDGRLATCSSWLMQGDQKIEKFTGYRFIGGFVTNDANLRKGALENMKSVAVRDLLGLRFRSPSELKELGLDASKLDRRAEFQSHEKDPGSICAPFGKQKGRPLDELSDDNLAWLATAVKQSLEDPAKQKFRSKNQSLLDACRDEYRRRSGKDVEIQEVEAQQEQDDAGF